MKLVNDYCYRIHIIWLGWRFWIVIIHREPIDPWWVAWTLGHKNIVFGNSPEEALENIIEEIRIEARKNRLMNKKENKEMTQWDVYLTGYIRMSADSEPTNEEILEYVKQNIDDLTDGMEVESVSEAR